ncbi:MAG: HipA domain-containing protein [Candidatus Contendobacter sp.]|nr:HipA domain-containing protein [Candidatus Contendobacter sp.]
MSKTYPILVVPPDSLLADEALGSKPKFWFRRDGQRWLFKEARENTGEDWAEKVAAEIAHRLAISAADVELAECKGRRGCASRSFVATRRGEELIHGNEILAGQVLGYDPNKRFRQNDHTLENIHKAIGKMFPSLEAHFVILRQLASYLMLDALIGNTDRHHENWGLLLHFEKQQEEKQEELVISLRVAPSFDHASSLGRELRAYTKSINSRYTFMTGTLHLL